MRWGSAVRQGAFKSSLAACAVDERGATLAEAEFGNDPAEHRALVARTRQVAPAAPIGVEGSASYGAAAAILAR